MANSDRYRRDQPYGRDDRGFVDRATDEVRSWFGDDDAEARRRREDRDNDRGDVYRGAPPEGRSGVDRDRDWDRHAGSDPRQHRVFPDHAEARRSSRGSRDDAGYGNSGWARGGEWGGDRREAWPEDRGDSTPNHGPTGGWREWRGEPAGASAGGWHVGKGPSGYTRSDERIREDVCDRLTDDPYVDASNIEVAVQGGEVTLAGHVDRREDKRRAEDIAESVLGVRDVQNQIRVTRG